MEPVAVIGGTGHLGFGLAVRWARAGRQVIIGSRQEEKAREAAARAAALAGTGQVSGATNREAATAAEIVVLTIPFTGQQAILAGIREVLRNKVVVDTTVPLRQYRPPRLETIARGSSAGQVQTLVPDARVVAAFHTLSQVLVNSVDDSLEGDILVCGDDTAAKSLVSELATIIGLRPVDAGPLAEAATLERLAALIVGLNQRYGRRAIGVRFTGM